MQKRLIFLVHARKMRLDLIKVQIAAASGMNEHNQKLLKGLSDAYIELQFPGVDVDRSETFEEQAKKLLADEVKRVYRVTRIKDQKAKEEALEGILGSGTAGGAVAAQATHEEQRAMRDLHRRYRKRR